MNLPKIAFATLVTSLSLSLNVQAFEVIKGEDINHGGLHTHANLNQTKQAEQKFLNHLDNTVGTENFENVNWTSGSSLDLSFPGAGTASLGGNGEIHNIKNTRSSAIAYDLKQGLYPASGNQYWFTEAKSQGSSTFTINFSEDIAAFGFYAYDLGDWGAELTLKLYSDGQLVDTIKNVHTVKINGSTTGSAIYVGIVGELLTNGVYETFDRVEFSATGNGIVKTHHDIFAFDDMTIAKANQLELERTFPAD